MAATDRRDRALILINPRARLAGARAWREPVLAELGRRYASELVEPRDAADTTRLACEASAGGYVVVVAAGGDGTVNAVAQGLAGTHTALGVLPLGSANDLAREYGLSGSIPAAARRIVESEARSIDLVEIGGRGVCRGRRLGLVSPGAPAGTRFQQRSPSARPGAAPPAGQGYRCSPSAA